MSESFSLQEVEIVGFAGSMPERGPGLRPPIFKKDNKIFLAQNHEKYQLIVDKVYSFEQFVEDTKEGGCGLLPQPYRFIDNPFLAPWDWPFIIVCFPKLTQTLLNIALPTWQQAFTGLQVLGEDSLLVTNLSEIQELFINWTHTLLAYIDFEFSIDCNKDKLDHLEDIAWMLKNLITWNLHVDLNEKIWIRLAALCSKSDPQTLRDLIAAAKWDKLDQTAEWWGTTIRRYFDKLEGKCIII